MMKEVLIVMAILGCGDDASQCQTVKRVEAGFASVDACRAASPAVLERLTDLAYPMIVAKCEKTTRTALAEAEAEDKPIG